MTLVSQYNSYSCVAACIESILKDSGLVDFSHEDFVKSNSDIFKGGSKEEGACELSDVSVALDRLGFDCVIHDMSQPIVLTNSDFLLFVYWNDLERDKHCVRLRQFTPNGLEVMNPTNPNNYDIIPHQWVKAAFRINRR